MARARTTTTRRRTRNARATRRATTRTPAGDAVSVVAVQVLRLAGLLLEAGDALAAPTGQTSARWRVLAAVEDAPSTVATIARALGQARQSVQRVADLLAAEGLAAYDDDPDDRRAMRLRLTARGRARLRAIQDAQRGWADRLGAAVGARELEAASGTLARLTDALAGERAD
jgi:DNA-binding MarR family transcriptional regulator